MLNGTELGGGSIRIHRKDVQERAFDAIGLSQEEAQSQFGFLLEAFNYGPPPHGGIAFGLDRLVALLTGADTIRDVMAFPKTATGGDPLTGAPAPITAGAAQGGRGGRGRRAQGRRGQEGRRGEGLMPSVQAYRKGGPDAIRPALVVRRRTLIDYRESREGAWLR